MAETKTGYIEVEPGHFIVVEDPGPEEQVLGRVYQRGGAWWAQPDYMVRDTGEAFGSRESATNALVTRPRLWTHVAIAKQEILADLAAGRFSAEDIDSFGALHHYVDANTYGQLCDDGFSGRFATHEEWVAFGNDMQSAVGRWLDEGGLGGSKPAEQPPGTHDEPVASPQDREYMVEVSHTIRTSVPVRATSPLEAKDKVSRADFPLPPREDWYGDKDWEYAVFLDGETVLDADGNDTSMEDGA